MKQKLLHKLNNRRLHYSYGSSDFSKRRFRKFRRHFKTLCRKHAGWTKTKIDRAFKSYVEHFNLKVNGKDPIHK